MATNGALLMLYLVKRRSFMNRKHFLVLFASLMIISSCKNGGSINDQASTGTEVGESSDVQITKSDEKTELTNLDRRNELKNFIISNGDEYESNILSPSHYWYMYFYDESYNFKFSLGYDGIEDEFFIKGYTKEHYTTYLIGDLIQTELYFKFARNNNISDPTIYKGTFQFINTISTSNVPQPKRLEIWNIVHNGKTIVDFTYSTAPFSSREPNNVKTRTVTKAAEVMNFGLNEANKYIYDLLGFYVFE